MINKRQIAGLIDELTSRGLTLPDDVLHARELIDSIDRLAIMARPQ